MKKRYSKSTIKKAFDNLPVGICYFNTSGLPVLCNRQMHKLVYAMTGRDLQLLSELTDALSSIEEAEGFSKDGNAILFPNNTVWRFSAHTVTAEAEYTQYVATDITEIYHRTRELSALTAEQRKTVQGMQSIVSNVVAITREEEILRMKMRIHDKVGWFLQRLHRYNTEADYSESRDEIVAELLNVADSLRGEIGHDDVIDPLMELCRVSKNLGVTVSVTGEDCVKNNDTIQSILQNAIRECVTNTIRHAEGDNLFVAITKEDASIRISITNNGRQPQAEVTEGGGLSSLRRQIEKTGGVMSVQSAPQYILTVTLPSESEE